MGATALLLAWLISVGHVQQAPTSSGTNGSVSGTSSDGRSVDPEALPVSLDRIQKALAREPRLVVKRAEFDSDSGLPTFRVAVEARKLTIEELLGPDYLRGPVPAGAMTHQEFLNMVTPKDVQGYAAFDNKQAITVALTSLAIQWALRTALEAFHNARDARAKEAARKEVREALEALRRARLEAGLPPK